MAMGKRKQREKQEGLWIAHTELASAPGHPFYQRLDELMEGEGFDEKLRLQFRLDFFNLFNHANFRGDFINQGPVYPSANCGAPDAGGAYAPCGPTNNIVTHQSAAQSGIGYSTLTKGPREIQYGLKLIF